MTSSASAGRELAGVLPPVASSVSIRAGILWMLLSTLLFVCQDSIARILLASYPATEIAFVRYFVHFALVGAFLAWRDPRLLVSKRPVLQLGRSSLLLATTLLGMLALTVMPFLDFQAVVWVTPVLVAALSISFLGETVTLRGWISVFVGLLGVWIIVAQGGVHISPLMVLPLLVALCNALYQIATRKLHTADSPLTTLFYTAIAGVAFCVGFLPFFGIVPTLADLALMLFLGVLGVASHFCVIRAFSAAPANVIAPFGYSALLWATFFSLLLFAEIPGLRTIIGAALIVAAGLSIFFAPRSARA